MRFCCQLIESLSLLNNVSSTFWILYLQLTVACKSPLLSPISTSSFWTRKPMSYMQNLVSSVLMENVWVIFSAFLLLGMKFHKWFSHAHCAHITPFVSRFFWTSFPLRLELYPFLHGKAHFLSLRKFESKTVSKTAIHYVQKLQTSYLLHTNATICYDDHHQCPWIKKPSGSANFANHFKCKIMFCFQFFVLILFHKLFISHKILWDTYFQL